MILVYVESILIPFLKLPQFINNSLLNHQRIWRSVSLNGYGTNDVLHVVQYIVCTLTV